MMVFVSDFFEFRDVEYFREILKVKHRFVFAVIAKKRNVFAEIHILQMIRDETAVAALNAFAEFLQNFVGICSFHYLTSAI